jgi:hypothetical protein
MSDHPIAYGAASRGVSSSDVSYAADTLLRAGERPTTEKVRTKIGRGSPNTIGPLLDKWWSRLASRLDAGPAAFHRLPEAVAHVAEALWMQALEESRRRVLLEQRETERVAALDKERLELRSHILTLREGEMEARIQDRDRTIAELEGRVRLLSISLKKEHASRESGDRRLASLEAELTAVRQSRIPPIRPRPKVHRRRSTPSVKPLKRLVTKAARNSASKKRKSGKRR